MPEFLTRNLKIAISAEPEASYSTMKTASGDLYHGMLTTGRGFYLPEKEKQDDLGKVGHGREFATEQRSDYIVIPSVEITEELNIDTAAILFRRAMGAADNITEITGEPTGSTDHIFTMSLASAGRQLPSTTLLWALGGADFIWGGVVVESFAISQTNADVPTYTASLLGSGLHKRLRNLTANGKPVALASGSGAETVPVNPYTGPYPNTATSGDANTLKFPPMFPAPQKQRYMLGAESKLVFTDGYGGSATEYSLTGGQRLKSFSATLTNNHRTDDRRAGDPRIDSGNQTSGDPRQGHYVNRMLHGDRTIGAEMTVMLDDQLREWTDAYNDTEVTSFAYTARGNRLQTNASPPVDLASGAQGEFEVGFPRVYFRGVRGSDDAGDAIVTITLFPVDVVSSAASDYAKLTTPFYGRIRTTQTAEIK